MAIPIPTAVRALDRGPIRKAGQDPANPRYARANRIAIPASGRRISRLPGCYRIHYWSAHPPGVSYPSDANEVSPGRYIVADYSSPGQVVIFSRTGQVVWRFRPAGAAALNHPCVTGPEEFCPPGGSGRGG